MSEYQPMFCISSLNLTNSDSLDPLKHSIVREPVAIFHWWNKGLTAARFTLFISIFGISMAVYSLHRDTGGSVRLCGVVRIMS
ncbi:hypothetical protein HG66A1_20110 [Gimesia chilikensis]|uniref:Uncharacterized protein n=1 Tax=Gimesia chilikensis TaxID=2605989 RepID=A0A517PLI3_9PLAN|nr:hypothetical protein HG66A1_20110 [Gimesia chilikensis]